MTKLALIDQKTGAVIETFPAAPPCRVNLPVARQVSPALAEQATGLSVAQIKAVLGL